MFNSIPVILVSKGTSDHNLTFLNLLYVQNKVYHISGNTLEQHKYCIGLLLHLLNQSNLNKKIECCFILINAKLTKGTLSERQIKKAAAMNDDNHELSSDSVLF